MGPTEEEISSLPGMEPRTTGPGACCCDVQLLNFMALVTLEGSRDLRSSEFLCILV